MRYIVCGGYFMQNIDFYFKNFFQFCKNLKHKLVLIAVLINFILICLLTVASFQFAFEKQQITRILQEQKRQVEVLSIKLEQLQRIADKRAAILAIVEKRAIGIDKRDYYSIADTIMEQEKLYGISSASLLALIQVESSFRNYAISSQGAIGLMQIQPITGKFLASELGISWSGEKTLFDPCLNIRLGSYYLITLAHRFDNMKLALEAYNKGPTRVAMQLIKGTQVEGRYSAKITHFTKHFHLVLFSQIREDKSERV